MSARSGYAGARIRRLRRERGLTQAQMAEGLGISVSYLNLLENDRRPATPRVADQMRAVYGLDLSGLVAPGEPQLLDDLQEAAAEPALSGFALEREDLRAFMRLAPRAASAFVRLNQAYRAAARTADGLAEKAVERADTFGAPSPSLAVEEVRDALIRNENHYAELEAAAERLSAEARITVRARAARLEDRLDAKHDVRVTIAPADVMQGGLRRYDRHARRLLLSEMLPAHARAFQMASQIAQLEFDDLINALAEREAFSSTPALKLYKLGLTNYVAGAVMAPYGPFLEAARASRYDLMVLRRRFEASFEQICHRLTTLRRPSNAGVAFFMIRVDAAGNVSKRFGGGVFPFARTGGACPRWNLFEAFRSPGRLLAQCVELADGRRYATLARTVERDGGGLGEPAPVFAIGVGCEAQEADQIVHFDRLGFGRDFVAEPIGVTCRLCDRVDCAWRAAPPLAAGLEVDQDRRGATPFTFRK